MGKFLITGLLLITVQTHGLEVSEIIKSMYDPVSGAQKVSIVGIVPAVQASAWDVNIIGAASATVSSVASSAANQTCLAANTLRKGASFFNSSTQNSFLKFAAGATTA